MCEEWESGPFCQHWSDPADCDMECSGCGHTCPRHWDDSGCQEEGCNCEEFQEEAEENA